LGDAVLTAKGDTLYYLAAFEGGYDLWRRNLLEDKTEIVLKDVGGGSLSTDNKMKELYLSARRGGIKKIDLAKGKPSNIDYEVVFNYRPYEERQNLYEHIWRQVKDKFYRADIHGVDWEGYHDIYAKFLPYINNEYDFRDMCGELLGELNASHTGARYHPASPDRTAFLGAFFDSNYEGDGLKICEIIYGGPLSIRQTGVKVGDIIQSIDGTPIKKGVDYYPLLTDKANKRVRLTVNGKDITVKAISQADVNELLYDRWVERNRKFVDSLSGGRLAYVHIRSMNGDCFRKLYHELLSEENRNRDAVIVDERHNGGGYLHDDLCHLLSGRQHSHFLAHCKYLGEEPSAQWNKPSCVMICEDDYSNACGFPREYQDLSIGKLIGTPVAGTASSVWWETLVNGITFGIPQVGRLDIRGDYGENTLLKPEIIVYNTPDDYLSGYDRQLETAVKEMLQQAAAFKEKHQSEFAGHPKP
jgi:C-terminal processing protease CtpA/Prc